MKTFSQNILNIFGQQGKIWLAELPVLVKTLSNYWGLTEVIPIPNMTFNYVAKALHKNEIAVVLKISCTAKNIIAEQQALTYFNGNGTIQIIDTNEQYHALLLEQAKPGLTLTSLPKNNERMNAYVSTMKKLHSKAWQQQFSAPHIRDWLQALHRLIPNDNCPEYLLHKALQLKNKLLVTMTTPFFLHGDLHPDNILKNAEVWLAIDPKGIIGELEFEIAAYHFMSIAELASTLDVKNMIATANDELAKKANLNAERINNWVFIRLMLMAAWQIEDNLDPSLTFKLAEQLA